MDQTAGTSDEWHLRAGELSWHKSGKTHYHAQLGLPEKGRVIKLFVVLRTFDSGVIQRHKKIVKFTEFI